MLSERCKIKNITNSVNEFLERWIHAFEVKLSDITVFLSVAMLVPLRGTPTWRLHTSLQIWIDQFCKFLAYEKWHRPQSWRGSFLIYLLSFTRFWAFDFDFWWCDTVKTSNSDLRFFTILNIICYTVPFFRNFQLIQSLRPYLSITISNCMCNEH